MTKTCRFLLSVELAIPPRSIQKKSEVHFVALITIPIKILKKKKKNQCRYATHKVNQENQYNCHENI